ncbi:hypothetical protein H9L39_19321 [Fusarium oxysporum f. sp. albedinis]|nr:hypothetical protein H9L39_19321 [Fusarium oxysporum f. sp. albedinis]
MGTDSPKAFVNWRPELINDIVDIENGIKYTRDKYVASVVTRIRVILEAPIQLPPDQSYDAD